MARDVTFDVIADRVPGPICDHDVLVRALSAQVAKLILEHNRECLGLDQEVDDE